MDYLQSKRFVHRDLAARNILVMSRQHVKISDFGLSRALGANDGYYQAEKRGRWPIKWYPPESILNGRFSHAGDVWSFGVTLWEIYTFGDIPYGNIKEDDLIILLDCGGRLKRPKLCPEKVFQIMLECWNLEPKNRPRFRHLAEYFMSQDFQNIIVEF